MPDEGTFFINKNGTVKPDRLRQVSNWYKEISSQSSKIINTVASGEVDLAFKLFNEDINGLIAIDSSFGGVMGYNFARMSQSKIKILIFENIYDEVPTIQRVSKPPTNIKEEKEFRVGTDKKGNKRKGEVKARIGTDGKPSIRLVDKDGKDLKFSKELQEDIDRRLNK